VRAVEFTAAIGARRAKGDAISRRMVPLVRRKTISSSGQGGAVTTIKSFIADGLFFGQPKRFINLLFELAAEADEARREV
jgi:hypothetical protein